MNVFDKLENSDWIDLLREQPQLADKCDKWDEFSGSDWSFLLCKQPQFADKLLHISVSDGSNAK